MELKPTKFSIGDLPLESGGDTKCFCLCSSVWKEAIKRYQGCPLLCLNRLQSPEIGIFDGPGESIGSRIVLYHCHGCSWQWLVFITEQESWTAGDQIPTVHAKGHSCIPVQITRSSWNRRTILRDWGFHGWNASSLLGSYAFKRGAENCSNDIVGKDIGLVPVG